MRSFCLSKKGEAFLKLISSCSLEEKIKIHSTIRNTMSNGTNEIVVKGKKIKFTVIGGCGI